MRLRLTAVAGLLTLCATSALWASPAYAVQYSDETVRGHSTESPPGATFLGHITFYNCDTGAGGCKTKFDFEVDDVKTDNAGPIIDVTVDIDTGSTSKGEIYLHDTYGKGSSSWSSGSYSSIPFNPVDGINVKVCNGGSRNDANNCKTYYYDDPYT
jgi:hypothetical protein